MAVEQYLVSEELRIAAQLGPDVRASVAALLERKPWLTHIPSVGGSNLDRYDAMFLIDLAGVEYLGRTEIRKADIFKLGESHFYLSRYGDGLAATKQLLQACRRFARPLELDSESCLTIWERIP